MDDHGCGGAQAVYILRSLSSSIVPALRSRLPWSTVPWTGRHPTLFTEFSTKTMVYHGPVRGAPFITMFSRLLSTANLSFSINTTWRGRFVLTNPSFPISLPTVAPILIFISFRNGRHEGTTHHTPDCGSQTQDRGLTQFTPVGYSSIWSCLRFPTGTRSLRLITYTIHGYKVNGSFPVPRVGPHRRLVTVGTLLLCAS